MYLGVGMKAPSRKGCDWKLEQVQRVRRVKKADNEMKLSIF